MYLFLFLSYFLSLFILATFTSCTCGGMGIVIRYDSLHHQWHCWTNARPLIFIKVNPVSDHLTNERCRGTKIQDSVVEEQQPNDWCQLLYIYPENQIMQWSWRKLLIEPVLSYPRITDMSQASVSIIVNICLTDTEFHRLSVLWLWTSLSWFL